ncbi:hypothetical protein HG530_010944 [Fusarium avenaceum]|nr:hypothetical protein HG530_010944 [Fusarium avenaceum]
MHSDTNTSLDVHARADHPGVGIGVGLEFLCVGRGVHADIQLSVGNVHVQVGEALEDGSKLGARGGRRVLGRGALAGHVGLETNTVDAKAVRLHKLGDADGTLGLGITVLEVVVVVVELGLRVCSLSHAEGDGDVRLANDAEEHVVAVGSILVQS